MDERPTFRQFWRVQNNKDYQYTGACMGYYESGFFTKQTVMDIALTVLWLVINTWGVFVLSGLLLDIFEYVAKLINNLIVYNFIINTIIPMLLSMLIVELWYKTTSYLVIKGLRKLSALRWRISTFSTEPCVNGYAAYYMKHARSLEWLLKPCEKNDADESDEDSSGYQRNPLFGIFIFFGYLGILAGAFLWLGDPINGRMIFWLGLCMFVPTFILLHVSTYLFWRRHRAEIAEAEAAISPASPAEKPDNE